MIARKFAALIMRSPFAVNLAPDMGAGNKKQQRRLCCIGAAIAVKASLLFVMNGNDIFSCLTMPVVGKASESQPKLAIFIGRQGDGRVLRSV